MEVDNRGGGDAAAAAAAPIDQAEGLELVAATAMIVEAEDAADDGGSGKRKRGRPPRGQVRATAMATTPAKKKVVEEEEEDVCFLCFDGGSLVLCDRRGCPKAYHPACVKRDEAFFQSKAKWNCGWHICSVCQKASHHMCYTCTYSLCKTCTKDADYLSVRGNKGFCGTCMRTVMLIEDNRPGNKDTVQVDFDDKTSWEYLFKMYWVFLKDKLSLTLDELVQAKKPCQEVVNNRRKEQPLNIIHSNSDCKSSISDIPSRRLEVFDSKKRRKKEQFILPHIVERPAVNKSSDKSSNLSGSTEWATKELLEFVAHMKNGDTSMLLPFDVQSLLLEYIKKNNLRDPQRKSQIICDARLMNLFLKPRVGHFEMLKLLEYHFLIKEDNKEDNLGNIVRAPIQVEGGGNNESLLKTDKDKKRKIRKKIEVRGQQTNLDEFAAIDVHNIKLIYLRRNLMENLVTASGNFHDKVLGSIVRIRISTGDLKHDMYRLVQVVGTFKASVPYKIAGKTVDVMLKILNLNKKELVAIDAISNQDFSEDECKRFRQSIKCGFLKRMTVGQVQEKARALLEVRLNEWLEAEILRLNHLRDRASENGRKKELRECVQKIELLKTPEERQRRLNKILQVHADPKMDPKCESDDDPGEISKHKQADPVKLRRPGFRKVGKDPISLQNKNKQAKFNLEKGPSSRLGEKVHELHKRIEAKAPAVSLSNGSPPSAYISETEKIWNYRDPNGKIQGPFCFIQLRKWSNSGYFPPDMRVWSINIDEIDSLHLADVLNGNFQKALPSRSRTSLPDKFYICEDRHSSTVKSTIANDGKLINGSWNCSSATSVHQITGHEDKKWNSGLTNGNITDSRIFSGQSSVQSWKPLTVNTGSNNSDSNFSFASVTKSSDSPDRLKINSQNLPSPTPVNTENFTNKNRKSSQSCAPIQELGMEELPSPTPKPSEREEKKAILDIENSPSPSPTMIDTNEKVDSSIGNSPISLPKDRDEKVQATESKPPDEKINLSIPNGPSSLSKMVGEDEKINVSIQNGPSSSIKMVGEDKNNNLSIENEPSSLSRMVDEDKKINLSIENGPSFSQKMVDEDKNNNLSIQNWPSSSPKKEDEDEKVDLSIQNGPSSSPKKEDEDEKINLSIQNGSNSVPEMVDEDKKINLKIKIRPGSSPKIADDDGKIDSGIQNMPSFSTGPSDGNKKFQANESVPPGTNLTFTSSLEKLEDRNEKEEKNIQNISSSSPNGVDKDEKVDFTAQNMPSFPRDERDGNEKIQANESLPPGPNVTAISSTAKLEDRDEKTGSLIQNISNPSRNKVGEDEKVSSNAQNLPSFPQDERDGNEKVQANESRPPGAGCTDTSSPPMPRDRGEKAGMIIENIPSPFSKMVDENREINSIVPNFASLNDGNEKVEANENEPPVTSLTCSSSRPDPSCIDEKAVIVIEKADPTDQKLPSENVQANESKPPGSSLICVSSIAEASDRDETSNLDIHNLLFSSQNIVNGDEKVDATSCVPNTSGRSEKVEGGGSQFVKRNEKSPEISTNNDVTPAPNFDQFSFPSTSNYHNSPSKWKEFDFEPIEFSTLADESVSDLLAEVDAMEAQGHVGSNISAMYLEDDFFEDSKNDYFASIPGIGHLFDYDIFDPSKGSNGEASTSNLSVDTRFGNNSGSQVEIVPDNQINWANTKENINLGLGGLTQGVSYVGWGSNPGLAQINTDMNQNMSFGFMGHERQQ